MKNCITISMDWHVIREGDRAQNATDPKLCMEYLRWGILNTDKIVLGGDIFDVAKSSYDNIMYGPGSYADLIQLIKNYKRFGKLEYLPGNHDSEMKDLWKLNGMLYLPEYKSVVMHGHQFTTKPEVINGPEAGTYLRLLALAERVIWKDIDVFFPEFFSYADEDLPKFWNSVQEYLDIADEGPSKAVENIFFGHIHGKPEIRTIGSGALMQTDSSALAQKAQLGGRAVNCGCNVKVSIMPDKAEREKYRADYIVLNKNGEIIMRDMRDGFPANPFLR